MFEISKAKKEDLECLLSLYTQFKHEPMQQADDRILKIWAEILSNQNHQVIMGRLDGEVISSCVITIIANLTHQARPYALVENVITDEKHRGKGYAIRVLDYAKEIALKHNCYKIMLMTGSKQESTLKFYERAGYNRHDKTAFIQWL